MLEQRCSIAVIAATTISISHQIALMSWWWHEQSFALHARYEEEVLDLGPDQFGVRDSCCNSGWIHGRGL